MPLTPSPNVEIEGGDFIVDAALLGSLLDIAPEVVSTLMREGAITSLCERGTGADEGRMRLSFFFRNRRARLSLDPLGHVLSRSVVDFGEQPLPAAMHRPGA